MKGVGFPDASAATGSGSTRFKSKANPKVLKEKKKW